MIDIRPPPALQSRSFSPLIFRQRGRALFDNAVRSPMPAPKAPKTDPSRRAKPAIRLSNPAHARSIFASSIRGRQPAILKSP